MNEKTGKPWTDEEMDFMRENVHKMSIKELAAALSRTEGSIRQRKHLMEICTFPSGVHCRKEADVKAYQKKFDLQPGDLILAPYSANSTGDDKQKMMKFVVTNIYPHMFEARLNGSKRVKGFPKNLYVAGMIKRCEE